jgi:signal transduction histidine kinase/ActR/RegA family two-component response regulator
MEHRALILAPLGKDATLIEAVLREADIPCLACSSLEHLAYELEHGVATVLVAEEALAAPDGRLEDFLARQPRWSDLPMLLITQPGADSPIVKWALEVLGNVTLLERPMRVAALASAVRSALRSRRRQYETRAHLEEREQADRRKDEFLATLAHELRNPLAPIRNAVSLLRMSGAGAAGTSMWEIMDRQVNHMVRLVDDLMEVSRITRGRIDLRKDAVDVAAVIAAAVETCQPLVESRKHRLTVTPAGQPLVVEADAVRLAQVFSNLLNNAAKYTNPGGCITVKAGREEGYAAVTVADTGIGIPAAVLPRVFDMFVQGDPRDDRHRSGLGIGLTLVRSLVEMHGGTVAARSAGENKGSEFIVRLPLANRDVPRHDKTAVGPKVSGLPRVLVVDDNQDSADSLGALLQLLGAEVRVSLSGQSALGMLDEFHPAAIFLDLGMPGMNGYETASRIRARPNGPAAKLIALTGWGQEEDRRRTHAAGFHYHLVKPADIGALQTVLASLVEEKRDGGRA